MEKPTRLRTIRRSMKRLRKAIREEHTTLTPRQLGAQRTLERRYDDMRKELKKKGNYTALDCVVRVHRIVGTIDFFPTKNFPWKNIESLPGILPKRPRALWKKDYGAIREFKCTGNIRELAIHYNRTKNYSAPFRVTICPRDGHNLRQQDLQTILSVLPPFNFTVIEVAFDFPIKSIIDSVFVQRHVLFGKTQPRFVGINPLHDSYGSRKGMKYIRAYTRFATDVFRIEPELHSAFLRRHRISSVGDCQRLARILQKHILFGELNSDKLIAQLKRNGFNQQSCKRVLEQVEEKSDSLWEVLNYLRKKMKLTNVRRLLNPMPEFNGCIRQALRQWQKHWTSPTVSKGAPHVQ